MEFKTNFIFPKYELADVCKPYKINNACTIIVSLNLFY